MLLLIAATFTEGYKILVLIPFPGPSHFLMFKVFIKELVNRGHKVTAISTIPLKEQLSNYTEIIIDPPFTFDASCGLSFLATLVIIF